MRVRLHDGSDLQLRYNYKEGTMRCCIFTLLHCYSWNVRFTLAVQYSMFDNKENCALCLFDNANIFQLYRD